MQNDGNGRREAGALPFSAVHHAPPQSIAAWQPFAVPAGASRAQVLALGRAACRRALAHAAREWSARVAPAPWADAAIAYEPGGAPFLAAPGAPVLSFCHARGLAGCALAAPGEGSAQATVGVDAEPVNAPALEAVRKLAEQTGEARLPWPDTCAEDWPARLWCAKEACVKAERIGADLLGRTLTLQDVCPVGDGSPAITVHVLSGAGDAVVHAPGGVSEESSGDTLARASGRAPAGAFEAILPLDLLVRSHRGNLFRVRTWRLEGFVTAVTHGKAPLRMGRGAADPSEETLLRRAEP